MIVTDKEFIERDAQIRATLPPESIPPYNIVLVAFTNRQLRQYSYRSCHSNGYTLDQYRAHLQELYDKYSECLRQRRLALELDAEPGWWTRELAIDEAVIQQCQVQP